VKSEEADAALRLDQKNKAQKDAMYAKAEVKKKRGEEDAADVAQQEGEVHLMELKVLHGS